MIALLKMIPLIKVIACDSIDYNVRYHSFAHCTEDLGDSDCEQLSTILSTLEIVRKQEILSVLLTS